jgi:hypothetical protein
VQSQSDRLQLATQILWADILPHCTGSFVPARHGEMSQNIGVNKISAPTKISLIFAKLQQSISPLTGLQSKSGKSKRQSPSLPSLSNISFSTFDLHPEAFTKILHSGRELSQMG